MNTDCPFFPPPSSEDEVLEQTDVISYDQFCSRVQLSPRGFTFGAISDIRVNPLYGPIERVAVPARKVAFFPQAYEKPVLRNETSASFHCAFCDCKVVEITRKVMNLRQRCKMRMCYSCYNCFFIWQDMPLAYCTKHHCLEDVRAWTVIEGHVAGRSEISQRCVFSAMNIPKHSKRKIPS